MEATKCLKPPDRGHDFGDRASVQAATRVGFRPRTTNQINFDRLLKLRLIVARFGEMDLAKWWNTRGQLGRLGTAAIRRGFPRTHYFAQARSVCAVAAHRCREVFDPPESVTLWRLTETIEEEFEAKWEHWLDQASEWQPLSTERGPEAHLDSVKLTMPPPGVRTCAGIQSVNRRLPLHGTSVRHDGAVR
jgi:hypothetical protein